MRGPLVRLVALTTLLLAVMLLVDRMGDQLQALAGHQEPPLPPLPPPPPLAPLRRQAAARPDDAAAWIALGEATLAWGRSVDVHAALPAFRHAASVPGTGPDRSEARRAAALVALAIGERAQGLDELAAAARDHDALAARFRAIVLAIDGDPLAGPAVAQACRQLPGDDALQALSLPPRAWLGIVDTSHPCTDPWTAVARARAWSAAKEDARAAEALDEARALARPMAHPAERLLPFTRAQLRADAVFAHGGPRVHAALARWPSRLPGDRGEAPLAPPSPSP